MSIIRLSVFGDRIFQPGTDGVLHDADRQGLDSDPDFVGDWGKLVFPPPKPDPSYVTKLTAQIKESDPKAGKPVVIMAHGFWYDPADSQTTPEQSDNPYVLNYHFRDPKLKREKHWRHTTSWPRGLGFEKEKDQGAEGLVVAFGWDSLPDLLKKGKIGKEARAEAVKDIKNLPSEEKTKFLLAAGEILAAVVGFGGSDATKELRAAVTAVVRKKGDEESVARLLEAAAAFLTELDEKTADPLLDAFAVMPGFYKQAYDRAGPAGQGLAAVIETVVRALPGRKIDLFCHSLGSRVAIRALGQLAGAKSEALKEVGRVLIVGGAEYDAEARKMCSKIENAMAVAPEFYNFTSRRDRVLTHLAGKYHPIAEDLTQPIGVNGLGKDHPHWIDLELDKPLTGEHALKLLLREKGLHEAVGDVGGAHPIGVLNHWYYFTSDANMKLFRHILHNPEKWEMDELKEQIKRLSGANRPR